MQDIDEDSKYLMHAMALEDARVAIARGRKVVDDLMEALPRQAPNVRLGAMRLLTFAVAGHGLLGVFRAGVAALREHRLKDAS